MKRILLLSALMLSAVLAHAQCEGWTWPEDRSTAEEKNVLYTDAMNSENYKAATKPLIWLLNNAPKLNTSIYINGAKIYSGLVENTDDETQKAVYIDSLMTIYDMRISNCGEEAEVISRKAYDAYKYTVKDPNELENVMNLFDKSLELNGKETPYYMFLPHMQVIQYNKKYKENLTDEQIINKYDKITEAIDAEISIATGDKKEKLEDYKAKIDGIFVSVVNVDCDFVKEKLAPQFRKNPTDVKLAKKIFGFMLNGKCTDDPLWLEAGEVIAENDPSFGLYKNLALKYKASGDDAKADDLLSKALEYAEEPTQKGEVHIIMGQIEADKGNKNGARTEYLSAVEADPTLKNAYKLIGDLYYTSFNTCKQEKDIVKDRAVFLAAYDMYNQAGDSKMAGQAKEQFPSKEEVFTFNYEVGQSISTGCWVGATTTIRTRD